MASPKCRQGARPRLESTMRRFSNSWASAPARSTACARAAPRRKRRNAQRRLLELRSDGVGPRATSSLVLRSRVMRNRNRWEAYERAVCDMVDRTSTEIAPWTLVEANDKNVARIKVLETLCSTLRAAFRGSVQHGILL